MYFNDNLSEIIQLQQNIMNDSSSQSSAFSASSKKLIQNLKIFILLTIIVLGVIGNTLNLIVFSKNSMRKISTFRYLFYLSMSDLFVLTIGATDVLINNIFQFEIRSYSTLMCKLHTFFTYFVTHICSVILMAVSIDRVLIMMNVNGNKHSYGQSESTARESTTFIHTHRINTDTMPTETNLVEPNKNLLQPTSNICSAVKEKKSLKIRISSRSNFVIELESISDLRIRLPQTLFKACIFCFVYDLIYSIQS